MDEREHRLTELAMIRRFARLVAGLAKAEMERLEQGDTPPTPQRAPRSPARAEHGHRPRFCEACGEEFTPTATWMKICPDCFKAGHRPGQFRAREPSPQDAPPYEPDAADVLREAGLGRALARLRQEDDAPF